MPVDFLTKARVQRYARYGEDPTTKQLTRYFHLDESDRELIKFRRGDHNKLGFAIQLCTVRFLGAFLSNPIEVPDTVVRYLAAQLGVDPGTSTAYAERAQTHREHAIRARWLTRTADMLAAN
jgi:TnpA family transposase